jgi:hypothetical protein
MSSAPLYDTIGATYTATRRTEPRIAAQVWAAIRDAQTVLNVGAGTGSYEPSGREVTAVEPSAVMRAQRPAGASVTTSHPAGGPNATATSSISARRSLASVCLSPDPEQMPAKDERGRCHFRIFTALATTRIPTTTEIISSAIIMSFAHGLIAETSVELNAIAVFTDRCR